MLSKFSVKKPYTVIVGIILVIVLGVVSFQHMSTDLLPSMNLPYVVVYTSYAGATPEQVEDEIARPMEAAFATLTDVAKITSSSRDNVAVVIMQFNNGANMDTAMIEISSLLDQLRGTWSDDVGAPVAMKLNPDMLPVAILSVTRDDMDILALSDYVEDELVPAFEALNGVASAEASGVIEQRIDVTIEQSRIDVLNAAILKDVDKELSKVEEKLDEAQGQLSDGKRMLARARQEATRQLEDAEAALDQAEQQLPAAIRQLTDQRNALAAQRETVAQSVAALEQLVNMDEGQRKQLEQLSQGLAQLRVQRENLEKQLADAEAAAADPGLETSRADILAQRDALSAELDQQRQYLEDLKLLDADALRDEVAALEQTVADEAAELDRLTGEADDLRTRRAATQVHAEDLARQIEAAEAAGSEGKPTGRPTAKPAAATNAPTDTPTDAPSDAPSENPTDAPSDAPSETPTDAPSEAPSETPTDAPSEAPTDAPSEAPTDAPSEAPTDTPTEKPTDAPTEKPAEEAGDASGSDGSDGGADGPAPEGGDSADAPKAEVSGDETPESSDKDEAPAPKDDTSDSQEAPEQPAEVETAALLRPNTALAEEATLSSLRDQLAAARETLAKLDAEIEARTAEAEALSAKLATDREALQAKQEALSTANLENADIQSRREAAETKIADLISRIEALDRELSALEQQIAMLATAPGAIRSGLALLDEQLAGLENSEAYQALQLMADPEGLNAKYAEAVSGLAQIDAGLSQMDGALEKLNNGILPGGFAPGVDKDTKISEARAQLKAGRAQLESAFAKAASQLRDAEGQLAKARKEFNEQRDEALKNAGLDGVITLQTVSGLIGAQNLSMPAGYVYDADKEQVLVRVGDKLESLDAVRRLKLFNLGLDSVDEVRLLDVARVELTDDREDVFTKLNGSDGILLSLSKQSTYSTADVADTVIAKAKTLMEADPGLHIVDLMNQGEYINIVVDSVLNNLMSGGGLAILILLLFLMDFRPTITVAFSIPISVVIAFVCMYFTGITLNVLSLSGLSLGIGMLVDNSIVAIENIYRLHDEERMPLLRACVEGVKSVSGALFASTLTTICVFLPIVFSEGMARDLFPDMGLTIAYSLLASLLVAMTVVPAMCSFLMRRSKPRAHRIFGGIQRFYTGLLGAALRVKPLVLLAALGLLAVSAMQVPKMGISFMPEVNSRQMSASLSFDQEMPDQQRKDQAVAIMNDMMQVAGVEAVGLMGGNGTMLSSLSSGGSDSMSYYIMIDESLGRKNVDIAREMSGIGEKYGADLTVQASTMDISMLMGSGISVEITGDDLDTLQAIALDVAELARQTEGTMDVDDGLEDAVPELRVEVDKEAATREGLTTGQVLQFIAQKLVGRVEITKVTLDGKEMGIYVEDGANSELRPEDLEDLEIEVESGEESKLVRIGDVSAIRNSQSLSTIDRASQRRLVKVSFAIAEGYSANLVSNDFEAKLKDYSVPAGYGVALTGENESVLEIMRDLINMLLLAVLFIFLIMVAQFQSFKSPIIVMFTIPLAFTGGLLALLATKMDLSIVSMLGFLVLSGVVVNNGIVFIDCVNQLRIGGMEKREALLETGRIRLRPILMTALTTILGMSTMALGRGTGAEMMQPMATVAIGGLSYATLMTLFVVPVLYDLLNGRTMKAREIQMIREAAGLVGDEVLDGEDRTDAAARRETGRKAYRTARSRARRAPREAVEETPVEAVEEAPVEAVEEAPVEAVEEAPVEAVEETPATVEAPVEAVAEAPAPVSVETPVENVKAAPVEAVKAAPRPLRIRFRR